MSERQPTGVSLRELVDGRDCYHDAAWVDYSITGRFRLPLDGYAACVIGRLNTNTGAPHCARAYQGGTLKLIKLESWTTWSWKELQSAQIPYVGSAWHTLMPRSYPTCDEIMKITRLPANTTLICSRWVPISGGAQRPGSHLARA